MRRRRLLAAAATQAVLAACATGEDGAAAPPAAGGLLTRWRTLPGGYLTPPRPNTGLPVLPSGMFVKWMAPGPLALRGSELVVADLGQGRLWRMDAMLDALVGVPGAPVYAGIALALGPDLSCWLLDPAARQVLRFTRDGRLLQRWRLDTAVASPSDIALADGGATLLLADGLAAAWAEQRGPSSPTVSVLPERADGSRISGVNAIAVGSRRGASREPLVVVLDRLAGVVHRVSREGRVLATLGRGELLQPTAIAVDAENRVWVLDAQDRSLKVLRPPQPTLRIAAVELGVAQIGGLAVDELTLAVSDSLAGQVVLHRIAREAP